MHEKTTPVIPEDLRWPRKKATSTRDIGAALAELAERLHADHTLPYEAYLQRLQTLRLVAEELAVQIDIRVLAIRTPRRGRPRGEHK